MKPAIPDRPGRPDRPACASQRAYSHLSLLRTVVAAILLAALLFRPSNLAVQERVKKGELFLFTYDIILLACYTDNGVQATRRREEGPRGRTGGGGGGRSE